MIPAAGNLVAGAGQAPSQDLSQLLTALLGGGSLGSLQQGQTVNVQSAPPSTERALLDALTRGRDMQEMGHGYNPRATWGNVLTAIASPIAGRRREKKADEELRELRRQEGEAAKQAKTDEEQARKDFYRFQKETDAEFAQPDQAKTPEWLQRLEYYRNASPEDRAMYDKLNAKSGGVTVNTGNQPPEFEMGTVPQGAYVAKGPDGKPVLHYMEGSEQYAEREAGEAADAKRDENIERRVSSTTDEIDHALSLLGGGTSGLGGAIMRGIPGSDAVDFEAALNTVRANLAFDELRAMREASKTGGALGAVSERELKLLESAEAGYDPDMSEAGKRRYLEKVRKHYGNFMSAINGEMPEGYDEQGNEVKAKDNDPLGIL